MQNNPMNQRRRPRYRARRTRRALNQIGNRTIQPLAGVSHQDETVQVRKMTYQGYTDPAIDTHGGVAFSAGRLVFTPNSYLTNELKALAQVYEQYCVSRMEIFANLGKGFNADNKFKLKLYSRVDPDDALSPLSLSSYFSVLSGQNTTLHTFENRGRVKVADFRPKFFGFGNTQATTPFLPSQLSWYSLDPSHYIDQEWRGLTFATQMPDESISPGTLAISFDVSLTFKFRGRVIAPSAYPTTITEVPITQEVLSVRSMSPSSDNKSANDQDLGESDESVCCKMQ